MAEAAIPRATVLMSVHNGAEYLRAAMESVLAQTFSDFEFLIIDDASTDESAAIVESFGDARIRLLRQAENIGLTRCLNFGLGQARGEFVARQDADDLSDPARLARQVEYLTTHPEVMLVGTEGWLVDAAGHRTGRRTLAHETAGIGWMALTINPYLHTAVMFRREPVLALGGYDESFVVCQDYELWLRIIRQSPVANLAEPLVTVREHSSSVSHTRREVAAAAVRLALRTHLAWLAPQRAFSEAEIDALASLRRGPEDGQLVELGRLIDELGEIYEARFPQWRRSADLRHARALMESDLGYRALTVNRWFAVQQFWRAIRRDPVTFQRVPWLRAAALLVLGQRAREIYTRLGLG